MAKSADAFRTISEVADWLETPAHVLRFWESKFSQVKPVKRAGGRRYYRPADMKLLGGIKKLLHDDGMTIKGVQKMLREKGVGHVSDFSQPLGDAADDVVIEHVEDVQDTKPSPPRPETGATATSEPLPTETTLSAPPAPPLPDTATPALFDESAPSDPEPQGHEARPEPQSHEATPDPTPRTPNAAPEPPPITSDMPPEPETENEGDNSHPSGGAAEIESPPLTFSRHKPEPVPPADTGPEPSPETPQDDDTLAPLPSFLQRRDAQTDASENNNAQATDPEISDDSSAMPKPVLTVDVPDDPDDTLTADEGVLTLLSRVKTPLPPDTVAGLEGLLSRLRATTGNATRE
jgi:DNA-binding transcriptional MerR regulator